MTDERERVESQPTEGVCWWCQERPAETREHKFKRTDLVQLQGDAPYLLKIDSDGNQRKVQGSKFARDSRGLVTFPKSLCARCNNESGDIDDAYAEYSAFLFENASHLPRAISFGDVYGDHWREPTMLLARYFAKHFGCRMVDDNVPVPASLRDFLNGEENMPDVSMTMITTDSVRDAYGTGLCLGPKAVPDESHPEGLIEYVTAAYIGVMGVRFQWIDRTFPDRHPPQFFTQQEPTLYRFSDERAVASGEPMGYFSYVPMPL